MHTGNNTANQKNSNEKRKFPHFTRIKSMPEMMLRKNKICLDKGWKIVLLLGFHLYLAYAAIYNFNKAKPLISVVGLIWVVTMYYKILQPKLGFVFNDKIVGPINKVYDRAWKTAGIRYIFYTVGVLIPCIFLLIDTAHDRSRLNGIGGIIFFILFMFLFSTDRRKINWRTVCWGFFLQFCFGIIVLRWNWGSQKFLQASELVITFLDFANKGTEFVYGFLASPPKICGVHQVFAFSVLQVVIYFGSVVSLLYYYGIVQAILRKTAWFMEFTLGTTGTESLNACACVFLGQAEAALLIKPYLERMTASELHAIITSGFSCIAGSLFAAYIAFGACPS